jgi:hypothetical protein
LRKGIGEKGRLEESKRVRKKG